MPVTKISIPAQGTTLEIEDLEATPAYHKIGGLMTYNRAEGQPTVEDATTFDSTGKEKDVGLLDEGQLSGTMQYNGADAGQAQMRTARKNTEERNFRLTLSDGEVHAFAGYVLNVPHSGQAGGTRVNGEFTIEITGDVTIT